MDAFFASVEQRDNPELRGKPVAVGGSAKRGVVAAASYEAREYGVRSAMPSITAARLCPNLIFTKHRFDVYKKVSQQIRAIFFEYTDLVEPLSLDEAFLDVTENKKHIDSAIKIAMEIRKKIWDQTQLTASAGVSINKFLAKVASDINKPNGLKVIMPEDAEKFVEELPVKKFFGVGKVTAEKMKRMGIEKGADLKKFTKLEMGQKFGKMGAYYYRIVRAQDDRPVNPNRIRKSIGAENTFSKDLDKLEDMLLALDPIIERVFDYMVKIENFGRTMTLKMKKSDFQTITRSRTFSTEVRDQTTFSEIVIQLVKDHWKEAGSIRLIGLSVSNLEKEHQSAGIQLKLDLK